MKYLRHIAAFFKKETVLCIAALLAALSAFFVPPSAEYLSYPDYRVLALLFCLMLVVAGLQSIGVFRFLGERLLVRVHTARQLALLLTMLCFFSAMLITNDVALLTFVPFGIMVLSMAGLEELLIPVIVLQTIAANLGSMLTPIGNPQNLYLYSAFSLAPGAFLLHMFPLTALSALLLILSILLLKERPLGRLPESSEAPANGKLPAPGKLTIYLLLFAVCLLCVARVLHWAVMLAILFVVVFLLDRGLFRKADYFLLLTFLCFFVFIGNVERIPAIADFLRSFIRGRELLLGALFSQGISNVPAAILLSGFTDAAGSLLYGVNVGGLGTLIASLASVISYRLYGAEKGTSKGAYLKVFTLYNLVFLLILYAAAALLLRSGLLSLF
ncbi:MAG: SLC13 family permease [Roseburia sp.]|nr:SLC13 family permease [Roseburia sp.]MCM1098466.1 SLC13 family permease [Ruminococcus flavefaciens]